MNKREIIPEQKKGFSVEHSKPIKAESKSSAEKIYNEAKLLLLDIDNWHKFNGAMPSYFSLCDIKGNLKKGKPSAGDHVRIGLPAPSSIEGKGFDWVCVDKLIFEENDKENNVLLTLRPSSNPSRSNKEEINIAHFYSKRSTSTFVIEQKNNIVVAGYYGRNEFPNVKDAKRLFDKIRNVAVAFGGLVGFSKLQWKNLINNIIDDSVKSVQL